MDLIKIPAVRSWISVHLGSARCAGGHGGGGCGGRDQHGHGLGHGHGRVMVFSVLLTWMQSSSCLVLLLPGGIWSLCAGTRGGIAAAQRDSNLARQSFGCSQPGCCCSAPPRHPSALPEPLLCPHLLPILPMPLHTLAPRAHPHPEPTRRALAEGKAFKNFFSGLHGIF